MAKALNWQAHGVMEVLERSEGNDGSTFGCVGGGSGEEEHAVAAHMFVGLHVHNVPAWMAEDSLFYVHVGCKGVW